MTTSKSVTRTCIRLAVAIGLVIALPILHYDLLLDVRLRFNTVGLATDFQKAAGHLVFLGSMAAVFGIGALFSGSFFKSRWMELLIILPILVLIFIFSKSQSGNHSDYAALALTYPAVFFGALGTGLERPAKLRWLQALWIGLTCVAAACYVFIAWWAVFFE